MANNNIFVQATVIALSLIGSANSLVDIDVQPQFVDPNDQDVVFTCAGGNDTTKMLDKMLRMRLMKLDNDDQWTPIAALKFDGSIDLTDLNATAVGRLGDVLDSHLVVTWPVAPDDVHGRYRCDAIVLSNTGDIVREKSSDVDVKSRPSDLSILSELFSEHLKTTEERLFEKVNVTMHRSMESSKVDLLSLLDSKIGDFKEYLDNKIAGTVSIPKPEEEVESIKWPEGVFTLLMPNEGCPKHPPAWIKSLKKMKTEPGDKYYPIDVPLHLANPHKKDGFIYRQFCTLPASPERHQPWPAGSYCVNSFQTVCPHGFKFSHVKVHLPFDKENFYLYYYPEHVHQSGHFRYSFSPFCCRHDGNGSNPIVLPVSHPFYLSRHGGRCQEVEGMDVVQDVFMMGTGSGNGTAVTHEWVDSNVDFRPDVSFEPYKEELCYYSRSKV